MSHQINLDNISTLPTKKISKREAANKNISLIKKLAVIQDKLFAQKKYSVLIILQGMDTSGKDGAVKHVFSGVNPAGCNVRSFKVPTEEEASHQFLWRVSKECPPKGMIQIFNRSHYEDVLMPIVNNSLSHKQIKERCNEINVFERGLINNNTILLKFFLNISHSEQVIRLDIRRTDPNKRWKFQKEDIDDIEKHNKYKKAYESVFVNCSDAATWQIIPADKKWYKNYCILNHIVNTLEKYDINYPELKLKSLLK
jgi:PPK2 family polyphosphate:nucleotide phosphotransferase